MTARPHVFFSNVEISLFSHIRLWMHRKERLKKELEIARKLTENSNDVDYGFDGCVIYHEFNKETGQRIPMRVFQHDLYVLNKKGYLNKDTHWTENSPHYHWSYD